MVALQSESSMQAVQFAALSTSIRGCCSEALPYLHHRIMSMYVNNYAADEHAKS